MFVKNIEEYRKIVAEERSEKMVVGNEDQLVPDSETP